MYTQCSKCETVFRLSADALRAANGQVRCGRCGDVFSALARLAEDASAFTNGESAFDMETRADAILQSAVVLAVDEAAPPRETEHEYGEAGVEIARLQILDLDAPSDHAALDEPPEDAHPSHASARDDADEMSGDGANPEFASLEFTLPPGELDRIFIEAKARPFGAIGTPLADPPADPPADPQAAPAAAEQPGELPPHPEVVAARRASSAPRATGGAAHSALMAADTIAGSGAKHVPAQRSRADSLSVPENIRLEMLAGSVKPRATEIDLPKASSRPPLTWLIAAMVLSLLLLGQFIHSNREWLAGEGVFGSALRATYSTLGSDLPAPPNFAAYQLRQWGVTGEPGANGTLRVRASVLNTAAQLQPFPLLRVSLANRFGLRLGTRDFEPAEYTGKPTVRMMAPGERVDATMDLQDPGKNAEGFEIDICLRGVNKKIFCVSDPKMPARR